MTLETIARRFAYAIKRAGHYEARRDTLGGMIAARLAAEGRAEAIAGRYRLKVEADAVAVAELPPPDDSRQLHIAGI